MESSESSRFGTGRKSSYWILRDYVIFPDIALNRFLGHPRLCLFQRIFHRVCKPLNQPFLNVHQEQVQRKHQCFMSHVLAILKKKHKWGRACFSAPCGSLCLLILNENNSEPDLVTTIKCVGRFVWVVDVSKISISGSA